MCAAVAMCGVSLAFVAPSATADDSDAVTSARSFPKATAVKKNLYAESVSTTVEEDSDWGSIESLDVPQTQSQAEKDAEAQAQAEEEAAAEAQAQAADRSQQRETLSTTTVTTPSVPASADASALASYATQFAGYPYVYGGNTPSGWDCSGFTQYVFAQFGKDIGRTTSAQVNAGTHVSDPQPGDLMISTDLSHAGIYLGNGLMIHAMNASMGTGISSVASVTPSSYYYIRVL
ncbi:C40 family peptidase [Bifidobacterium eulemuris]|uniref:C40 family peptidase n=3 Tax=Bifidobacterium eulemuris TaxID=1765219 RepID=A0A7L9SNE9_9BIFI|nr:C40 family peptidase [Bifidobacterium eulemuris]